MTAITGFVTNASQLAHYALIDLIKVTAEDVGWTTLRYDVSTENHELILKGAGYSGLEEIFIGFRSYQNANADWYNMSVAAMTGFLPDRVWAQQPGFVESGVPLHNQRIDYWISVSPQRICGACKVGTPVYESFYAGKFFPYARPSQYPYPICCAGMLNGASATRFSETTHSAYWKGSRANLKIRTPEGWVQPAVYLIDGAYRDTGGFYPLFPLELYTGSPAPGNIWGRMEGIFFIPGFNNVVENTLSIAGKTYVVIEDVYRTGHADYMALELS